MRTRRAFTLVEMVVVIGIIVVLAALTFAVGVAVVQNSEVRQTEATIKLLDAAVQEWEAQSDRKVSYDSQPATGEVYDIVQPDSGSPDDDAEEITDALFVIIARSTAVKQILAQVDPQFVRVDPEDPEDLEFRDAWGNLIVAILPGRAWVTGDPPADREADGTIQTVIERACGRTANRQICFVSGGPDGKVGDIGAPVDSDDFALTRDNIYSYLAQPQPQP